MKNMIKVCRLMLVLLIFATFILSCGRAADPAETPSDISADTIVYITKTGDCYHRSSCSCLKKSKIALPLGVAVERFRACKLCQPPTLDRKR